MNLRPATAVKFPTQFHHASAGHGCRNGVREWIGRVVALAVAAASSGAAAAPIEKPVAGQRVRFRRGIGAELPQVGPDGKVRQCVLVALRQRTGSNGARDTRFALNIGRGAGLAFTIHDDDLPTEQVLDDQAEVLLDDRAFPAVGFPVGTAFVFHPGDAAGALGALGKATRVQLRSAGAGIDSGAIEIALPAEALSWLKQCGKVFDIAIDRPTDPNAPDMPVPRSAFAENRDDSGDAGGTAGHGRQAEDRGLGCLRTAQQRGPHHCLLHPPPLRDRLGAFFTPRSASSSW